MDLNEFKSNLKSGKFSGAYIFAGEEDYLVRYYLSSLRTSLMIDPAFAVFNNPVYDGPDIDFGALTEDIKAPPMMSDYKLIEWRHADFTSLKEKGLEALAELVELTAEYPYAVLAFTADAEGIDFGVGKKPSSFISKFGTKINILRFDKSTENQLYAWLKKHFDAQGVSVTLDTLRTLVFRSGRSMDVLKNEVDKLCALAKSRQRTSVTPEDVTEVSSSTPECDTFALSNAITERNKQKAYVALEEMKFRRVDPMMIMGMMAKTYDELLTVASMLDEGMGVASVESALKMNSYKLKLYVAAAKRYSLSHLSGIVSSLARVDAASKFGGVTGYTAIELFISQNI